jgi:hypothetical protein
MWIRILSGNQNEPLRIDKPSRKNANRKFVSARTNIFKLILTIGKMQIGILSGSQKEHLRIDEASWQNVILNFVW